jgi:uncharacterized repeat protein (TIGR01451 family)
MIANNCWTRPRFRQRFVQGACILVAGFVGCGDASGPDLVLPGPIDGQSSIDLQLTQMASQTSVVEGAFVTFTVTVLNAGPVTATSVLAADTLPAGLSYVAHVANIGTYSPGTGLWTIGTLGVGAEAVLSLTARVDDGTAGSSIMNRAGVISTAQHDSVPSNNVAIATIIVGQQQAVGTVFHSTWGHGTGNSRAALSDGGRWDQDFWCTGRDSVLSVTLGAPLGWTRTPNVFRTTMRGGTGSMCGAIQHRDVVPASTTHWGRLYFRNDESIWGGAMHNYSYNFVGDIQMVYFRPNGESAGWFLGFSFDYAADGASWSTKPHPEWARGNWVLQTRQANATSPSDFTGATSPNRILMDHGAWYRYEWMVEYITPTSFRFWPRLYNAAGTLLYDASNFFNIYHLTASLSEYYAGGGAFGTSSTALMRHIGIGNEGRPGPDTGNHWYTADFAISLDGWIGSR